MSQDFEENFQREGGEGTEGGADDLEYDDSAFYYFSLLVLSLVLIPVTWTIVKSLIWGNVKIETYPGGCQCVHCKAKVTIKQAEVQKNIFKSSFYFKIIVASFFWYIWY